MLSSCSLGSKDIFSQIRVGMTYNEFRELNESEKSFYYMNYAFIEEKSDQSIVVEFSSDMQGVVKKNNMILAQITLSKTLIVLFQECLFMK